MKPHNILPTLALLITMVALLGMIGWILSGASGAFITVGLGTYLAIFARGGSKHLMMRAIGARRLQVEEAPSLYAILDELCRRAGLSRMPDIYLMDASVMMGFSAGSNERGASIVLTGPLVQGLNAREISGVLAHEICHIHAGDLEIMGMADLFTRITRTLSLLGLFLVILNVPLSVSASGPLPWSALMLLIVAPLVNHLLQQLLSRSREYEADEDGVNICGDPASFASALQKLESPKKKTLRHAYLPHALGMVPSLLRSHPMIQDRVDRILKQSPTFQALPESLVGEAHGFPKGWSKDFSLPVRWLMRWWR
ncbi:MAG: peptidase M48 [Rhodospirillaceae bacterium]|nr:MAG: peptidase M48 [Rhodospirillaceae bacterium]